MVRLGRLFAYAGTVRPAAFRVTIVGRVIHAGLALRATGSCDSAARQRFCLSTFPLVLHRNSCSCCGTGVPVGFAVTTANRPEFSRANGGPGFADALRIRHLALARLEITILLGSCAGAPRYPATGGRNGRARRFAFCRKLNV